MKGFLKTCLSFSIPIVCALVLNEAAIRTIPNEYTTKIKYAKQQLDNIEVLILGSSHALRAVNPHAISGKHAFNLAMISQPLELDHRLLFNYKERLTKLECVIISISHFTLSQTLTEGEIKERLPYYKHFYKLKMPEIKPTALNYYSIQFDVDFSSTAGRVLRRLKGSPIVMTDSLGWMGNEGKQLTTENAFIADAAAAAKRHNNSIDDLTHNLKLLEEIIEFGKSNKVKIILLNTPKTHWYNTNLKGAVSDRIDTEIQKLIEGRNAKYLNFKNHSDFDISDFKNSDHLNEKGAKKLTKMLESYL